MFTLSVFTSSANVSVKASSNTFLNDSDSKELAPNSSDLETTILIRTEHYG
jgi:hypothetical protein